MRKVKICKVHGRLKVGTRLAACGYNIVGDNSKCGAHGNTKCEHMIKKEKDND